MAANKIVRFGPVAMILTTPTNIINTAITSLAGPVGYTQTQPYAIVRHIRLVNKTAGAVTFSMFVGATGGSAAGTEFMGLGNSIAANSYLDWYGQLRLDSGDFLTGFANTATALTFQAEGEIGIA
jgi:hypothetical protein